MKRISRWAVLAAGVVGVNLWAASSTAQVDLSAGRRFSLTAESREVARAVDGPLRITAFLYERGGAARDARFLLGRYRELNRHIDYRIVDPDERPGEAARYGITGYSTVVVEYRSRRVDTTTVDEVRVSSAILRVLRGDATVACFLTGHGEPGLDDEGPDGLSSLAALLDNNAFEARPLDLRAGGPVPDGCGVVVVVGTQVGLLPAESDAITTFAQRAGRLAVLASPFFQDADPNPLLAPWGVTFVGGLAVDPERSEGLDVSNVIVSEFPSSSPVVDGVPSLQFPAPGGLLVDPAPRDGLTVSRLAVTSAQGFIETEPDTELVFDGGDFPGPVVLAAAADDSRVEPSGETRVGEGGPRIVRTRLFVTGNALWVTNRFLDQLGNRRFALNALLWLGEEEQLLTVASQPPQPRALPWTRERQRQVVAVTVGLAPGAVAAIGVARLTLRRRRRP
ncbi:MAG: DUF4350 domain-containing protein [Acidimicrobiales bacterium]